MNTDDITLPELGDDRIDEIETALFARIAEERRGALTERLDEVQRARARAVRRGRIWMGAAAAAAFVAVAAVVGPQLGSGASSGASSADAPVSVMRDAVVPLSGAGGVLTEGQIASGTVDASAGSTAGTLPGREVIATASASVQVADARDAAEAIAATATAAGGYVESMSLSGSAEGSGSDVDPAVPGSIPIEPGPYGNSGAWITVRVPADQLTATIAGLAEIGEVTASQVDRRDVTTETVDLRARITSLEASVTRLTDLMAQATSTADLISAESALAQRQAELDSLRQQLTWLDSQVDLSTLTVTLTERAPATTVDPAGFGDGLAAGWNGLVAALSGLVIGIGFLLPWVAVVAVAVLIVWGVRRLIRRRGTRATAGGGD